MARDVANIAADLLEAEKRELAEVKPGFKLTSKPAKLSSMPILKR